jgi:serine/threonine protein kinase
MTTTAKSARTIFLEAVENREPNDWPGFLDTECGSDRALRREVQRLLDAHARNSRFMEGAAAGALATAEHSGEHTDTTIGPYKLLQPIGEGGFGVVYMAEQTEPVERRVALKIIKPGMDSRQVIARFEAERQALALMDHPNIATVFDAATTENGRPYFVMELVKGIPITKYCDDRRLSLRQRLELVIPVCQAIQHAHQKGIIHRDIKPTNVLVTQYDGRPVPKVIDFGVAKATAQKLTERTMFTEFGQVIGTLEYMSPEQAEINQLDIDTRSDIYSLGVLLYELLTGSTPFEKQKLRAAAFPEMLRIIREEEPPRPSTRLSTLRAEALSTVSDHRSTDPRRISTVLRGELDWIVMKALDKDRSRRYESASAFAADIERYLNDEPVQACPPSLTYRAQKFCRRNAASLTPAALVAVALVAGTVVSTWQAVRARQAPNLAGQRLAAQQQAETKARGGGPASGSRSAPGLRCKTVPEN